MEYKTYEELLMIIKIRKRSFGLGLAIMTLISFGGLSGCYSHVVGVKGPNSTSYDVYEPHMKPQEEEQIKGFFGGLFSNKSNEEKKR